jgi:hypothetical protein
MYFEVDFIFLSFFKGIVMVNHNKIIINFKKLLAYNFHALRVTHVTSPGGSSYPTVM